MQDNDDDFGEWERPATAILNNATYDVWMNHSPRRYKEEEVVVPRASKKVQHRTYKRNRKLPKKKLKKIKKITHLPEMSNIAYQFSDETVKEEEESVRVKTPIICRKAHMPLFPFMGFPRGAQYRDGNLLDETNNRLHPLNVKSKLGDTRTTPHQIMQRHTVLPEWPATPVQVTMTMTPSWNPILHPKINCIKKKAPAFPAKKVVGSLKNHSKPLKKTLTAQLVATLQTLEDRNTRMRKRKGQVTELLLSQLKPDRKNVRHYCGNLKNPNSRKISTKKKDIKVVERSKPKRNPHMYTHSDSYRRRPFF